MRYNNIRQLSVSVSVLIHLLLAVLLLLIKFSIDYPVKDYVELSFGNSGGSGSSGGGGLNFDQPGSSPKLEQKEQTVVEKSEEVKEVELPKAKNTEDVSVTKPIDKNKDKTTAATTKTAGTDPKGTTGGFGNNAEGEGGFGYDIDWGGKGTRRIYNYPLPSYPEGVEKEVNIRLKFTIRPDGTVGTIIPLQKADTKLENAAINSLRQWRFEPLATGQKQVEQFAVIVFPYRLQ